MKLRSRLSQYDADQLLEHVLQQIRLEEWIEAGIYIEKGLVEAVDPSPFKAVREQIFQDAPQQIQHGKIRYHIDSGNFDDAEKALQSLRNISTPDYKYTVVDLEAEIRKRRQQSEDSILKRIRMDEDAVDGVGSSQNLQKTDVHSLDDTARASINPAHAPFLPPEYGSSTVKENTQATRTAKVPVYSPAPMEAVNGGPVVHDSGGAAAAVRPQRKSNIALFLLFLMLSGVFIAIGVGILLALTRPDLTPVINAVIPQLSPEVQVVVVDATGNPVGGPTALAGILPSLTPFVDSSVSAAATPFGGAGALVPDLTAIAEMSQIDGAIPTAVPGVIIPPTVTATSLFTLAPAATLTNTPLPLPSPTSVPDLIDALTFTRYSGQTSEVMALIPESSGYAARSVISGDGVLAWAPDGERFAFADERNIRVLTRDDTLIHTVNYPGVCEQHSVRWAPDGTELLVACEEASLFALSTETEGDPRMVISLLPDRAGIVDVMVSPNGERIVGCFDNGREASLNQILISQVFSSAVNALTPEALSAYIFPAGYLSATTQFECSSVVWSSDSRRIAFAARGGSLGHADWDIYTAVVPDYDLASNQRFLTEVENVTEQNAGDDLDPAWSGTDDLAYAAEQENGQFDILRRDRNGQVENLTNSPAMSERYPDWQS